MGGWERGSERIREQKEKAKLEAKKFDHTFGLGKAMGMWGDEAKGRSTEDLLSTLEAAAAQRQKQREELESQKLLQENLARQRENEGAQAMESVLGDIGFRNGTMYGGYPSSTPPRVGLNDVLEGVRRNPKALNAPSNSMGSSLMMEMLNAPAQRESLGLGQILNLQGGGRLIGTGGAPHFEKAEPVAAPPGAAVEIFTQDGKPTGKAALGDKIIDLSPPNSNGKDLTQTEVDRLAALEQAGRDLERIEQLFESVPESSSGPVMGRVRGLNPYDKERHVLEQAINAAVPNLARGVFREVGVLTDEDVKRYAKQFPTLADPPATRKAKLVQLRKRLEEGKIGSMDEMKKAGRNVSGFEDSKPTAKQFESEEQARSAGFKSGDVVEIYDAASGRFRKARLK